MTTGFERGSLRGVAWTYRLIRANRRTSVPSWAHPLRQDIEVAASAVRRWQHGQMADDLDLSSERLDALFSIDDSAQWPDTRPGEERSEAWLPYVNAVISGPPDRSLAIVLAAVHAAPNDDALTWLGAWLIEPLLDRHAQKIFDRFEHLARTDAALRTALGGAMLDIRPRGKRRGRLGREYEARVHRILAL
jgi:hypothetical protein